jgi:hypothetical protein
MIIRLIRNITALALLPLIAGAGYALINTFTAFNAHAHATTIMPFWLGVLVYAVVHVSFNKPMRMYVFGHELTHAIAGVLMGAQIKKFQVGQESGYVKMSKVSIWIALAPYFVPIYSCLAILAYIALGYFTDNHKYHSYFLFVLGLTISFHCALTYYIIRVGQSDLKIYGVFFSCVLIVLINIIVFDVLFSFTIFERQDWLFLIERTVASIEFFYGYLWTKGGQIVSLYLL